MAEWKPAGTNATIAEAHDDESMADAIEEGWQ